MTREPAQRGQVLLDRMRVYESSVYESQMPSPLRGVMQGVKADMTAIQAALSADRALTFKQLERYFGASPDILSELPHITHPVEPVHMRASRVVPTFVALKDRILEARPSILSHYVGAAEARLMLNIPPEQWRVSTEREMLSADPDAVWTPSEGVSIAVEYDRGSYTRKKIVAKLKAFSKEYDSVLWVVPTPADNWGQAAARGPRLRKFLVESDALNNIELPVKIISVKWWRGETETVMRQVGGRYKNK